MPTNDEAHVERERRMQRAGLAPDAVAQSLRACRYQADRWQRALVGTPCGRCAPCVARAALEAR